MIKKENDWWIGWIEEVPGVNCQEHTGEELLETLRITLKEALEFNKQNACLLLGLTLKKKKSLYEAKGIATASPLTRL